MDGQGGVGGVARGALHHQRLAGFDEDTVGEDIDLVVEARGGRDGLDGVAKEVGAGIADIGQLDDSLAATVDPVGHRGSKTDGIVAVVELHLRDTHDGFGTALAEVEGAVHTEGVRSERGTDKEGSGIGGVAEPVDLRLALRSRAVIVHRPGVHTGGRGDGGTRGVGDADAVVVGLGGAILAHHLEVVGVVGLVGVVGKNGPDLDVVGAVAGGVGGQGKHGAGGDGDGVLGRNGTGDVHGLHCVDAHLVFQLQATASVGVDTAVADADLQFHIRRHVASGLHRAHQSLGFEVVGQRDKLEGTRTGGRGATKAVEHVGRHTGDGDTHTLHQAVVGAQVDQRTVEEVGVGDDGVGVRRLGQHPSGKVDTSGTGTAVEDGAQRVVHVVANGVGGVGAGGIVESVVVKVERDNDIVNEAAVLDRTATEAHGSLVVALAGSHLHRVVHHIGVVGGDDIERRTHQVGRAVVVADNHVVGHQHALGSCAADVVQGYSATAVRGVDLVAQHLGCASALVEQQHAHRVAQHIVHLVARNHDIALVAGVDGIVILVAEGVVRHTVVGRKDVGGLSSDVHTRLATLEGATVDHQAVGIARIDHGVDTHAGRGVGKAVDERATLEAAVRAVQAHGDHVGQRHVAAHEVDVAEPHVGSLFEVDQRGEPRQQSAVCIGVRVVDCGREDCHTATLRLEHHVGVGIGALEGGHREGVVVAGGQFHHQAVADAATAQGEEELLDGVEVGRGTADAAHTAHRTVADDELREGGVVVGLMVAHQLAADGQRILHPHLQGVESGGDIDIVGDGDIHICIAVQRTTPVVVAEDGVVDIVADADGIHRQRTEVFQLHRQAARTLRHRGFVAGRHQLADAHIVEQGQVGPLRHHQGWTAVDAVVAIVKVRRIESVDTLKRIHTLDPVDTLLVVGGGNHLDG